MGKPSPRTDRRYKDAANAPVIVSEKRMTFFMADQAHQELRRRAALFRVHNAEVGLEADKCSPNPRQQ